MNNSGRCYFVDLTTTDACNFNCSYCFEHGNESAKIFSKNDYDLLIKRIYELLSSKFFRTNYDMLCLNFWGGEPTLNSDFIRTIFKEFESNDRIVFLIYTNGFDCSKIYDLIDKVKNQSIAGFVKFMTQISYDGQPVHDICRKTKAGKLTSHKVRKTIFEFDRNNFPYMIKSTITPATLKYINSCYEDIFDIYSTNQRPGWRNDNYFPTVDLYHFDEYNADELDFFENEFKESLIKIARSELEYQKSSGKFFFAWFNANKAICSAGANTVCMNYDGSIYKCHGCLYPAEKDDHFITSIKDSDFANKLEESHRYHSALMKNQPIDCMSCTAPFCLRCNAAKYSDSKQKNYGDRWTDYSIHSRLCSIFKINEKIVLALRKINNQI